MLGFLNVYKPKGKTSHDVVAILRRVTKIKQIGHTGTLDPFAEGVLPICIGKATRLIEYLEDGKAYIGTVQLGQATDTYDIEGKITETSDKKVSLDDIKKVLQNYIGDIEQTPPIYSAIKVGGKKLYEYAREGKEVEVKSRKVRINEIKIISFNKDKNLLELYIDCSKGTYIRSIANDLGIDLGVYGHLIKLVRVKAGKFSIKNAVPLDELNTKENVEKYLAEPTDYLPYEKYELDLKEYEKVSHGMNLKLSNSLFQVGTNVILVQNGALVGIGQFNCGEIKCKKVFI